MFEVVGKVLRVIDGDTIEVKFPIWFKQELTTHVRFDGLNCPEKDTEVGEHIKQLVADMLTGKTVKLKVRKLEKYGRALAVVMLDDFNVNEWLLQNGYAVPMNY